MKEKALKAVTLIADARQSKALKNWLETGDLDAEMDIGEAYRLLNIDDRTLEDEVILSAYYVAVADNPSSAELYNKAINAIGTARQSPLILQAFQGVDVSTEPASSEWPVGLENIGNTCYLNSLLQFFFTLPELRNLVLHFDDVKMDLHSEGIASKRVGSRRITLQEIERAQKCKSLLLLFDKSADMASCFEPTKPLSRNDHFSTSISDTTTRSSPTYVDDVHSGRENTAQVDDRHWRPSKSRIC